MKMLLWKVCSCNLRAHGGESSGSSVYLFSLSLSLFFFFLTHVSLCQCQCDPMLSMCARGSRRCRFVLEGPDRSPVCRRGEQHYCLVLPPSFTTKAQHQQSREAVFSTFGFPPSFPLLFLTPPPKKNHHLTTTEHIHNHSPPAHH